MTEAPFLASIVTLAVVGMITVVDYQRFRIPNAVTIPFGLAGLAFHSVTGGAMGLASSLLGMFLGVVLLLAPYIFRGFGGGDVKLLAATGAWLGAWELTWVFVVSGVVLGIVSAFMICRSAAVRRAAFLNLRLGMIQLRGISRMLGGEDRVEEVVLREDRRDRAVPFAVVLAIGLVLFMAWKWMTSGVG